MADQRPVRVLAPLLQELVVHGVVDALPFFARVPRQQMDDGVGTRILGREVQRHAGLEEFAQGLVKSDACIGVAHQRWNGNRG